MLKAIKKVMRVVSLMDDIAPNITGKEIYVADATKWGYRLCFCTIIRLGKGAQHSFILSKLGLVMHEMHTCVYM